MLQQKQKNAKIYEGNDPYLFISYSHKDSYALERVKSIFDDSNIRYWYDDGLHSGDDWNMIIANRLQNASICLLLLSGNSANSEYVKNELNFAMNRRIPIHTLLINNFELPPDIEMMTGRIQMVEMQSDYGEKLLKSIPAELYYSHAGRQESAGHQHPLFTIDNEVSDRQGTKTYVGHHNRLNYKCTITQDAIKISDKYDTNGLSVLASNISHPIFPRIIDVDIQGNQMWTYQEYRSEVFLDRYLETNALPEDRILSWTLSVIDAMAYLFKHNLGLRDFSRGSMVVVNDCDIGISRLQNMYYGLIRLQLETKAYYFEKELQEIAIFLAQLCLRKTPSLPLSIIKEQGYSKKFLDTVNLVIQKCVKVNGKTQYTDFTQIKNDLQTMKLTIKDKLFLSERSKTLDKYDAAKAQRTMQFASERPLSPTGVPIVPTPIHATLEAQFGFEGTVALGSYNEDNLIREENKGTPSLRILICATGQITEFYKDEILIGKGPGCDLAWTQPYVSRLHARLCKISESTYLVEDLGSSNGTYLFQADQQSDRLPPRVPTQISAGTVIGIAETKIKIL